MKQGNNTSGITSPSEAYEKSVGKLKILLIISSPIDESAHTNYEKELRNIFETLNFASVSAALISLNPPTREALHIALSSRAFDIVHFIGHSNETGIQLEQKNGTSDWVSISEFNELFLHAKVKLLILNACESFKVAYMMECGQVPNMIVTTEKLSNELAVEISSKVYTYLSANFPVATIVDRVKHFLKQKDRTLGNDFIHALGQGINETIFDDKPPSGEAVFFGCEPQNNIPRFRQNLYDMVNETLDLYNEIENDRAPFIGIKAVPGKGKTALAVLAALKYSWRFSKGIAYVSFKEQQSLDLALFFSHFGWGLEEFSTEVQKAIILEELSQGPYLLIFDEFDRLDVGEQHSIINLLSKWDTTLGGKTIITVSSSDELTENFVQGKWIVLKDFPTDACRDLFIDTIGGEEKVRHHKINLETVINLCLFNPKLIFLTATAIRTGVPWGNLQADLAGFTGITESIPKVINSMLIQVEQSEPSAKYFLDSWSAFVGETTEECWYFVTKSTALTKEDANGMKFLQIVAKLKRAAIVDNIIGDAQQRLKVDPTISKYLREYRWKNLPSKIRSEYLERHVLYNIQMVTTFDYDYIINNWENIIASLSGALSEKVYKEPLLLCKQLVGTMETALIIHNQWYYSSVILPYAITVAIEAKDNEALATFYYVLGCIKYRLAEYDESLKAFDKCESLSTASVLHDLVLQCQIEKGRHCYRVQKYEDAEALFASVLKKHNSNNIDAKCYHELGRLYYRKGELAVSLDYLQKSLALKGEDKSSIALAQTYHEIGRVYHDMKDYFLAKEFYEKSLDIKKVNGDAFGLQATIHQIGLMHYDKQELILAKERYEECIDISNDLKDRFWIIHNKFRYACLMYLLDEDKDSSVQQIKDAYRLSSMLKIRLKDEISEWLKFNNFSIK